jgi:lipopolysaccharide/colanic/teichoic acid biosynthesis glycosyltransferase
MFLKRLIDIIASLLALLVLLLPMGLLYLCLWAEGGNPIFKHLRVGKNGVPFYCLKFRSMIPHAEMVLETYLATHLEAAQEWAACHKLSNDPRITRLGHFLRKSSLDELPQLYNVLKGEMSLVGPRPIVVGEMAKYKDALPYYLRMQPGLTGLWQVSGRSNTPYAYRIFLDRWYATHHSLCLDIVILLKTLPAVLLMHGSK